MPDAERERERVRTIQEALDANKPGIVQIAVHYGKEHQTQKLIEEMAEFTVALIHEKKWSDETISPIGHNCITPLSDNSLEEFADVLIMIEQFKLYLSDADHRRVSKTISEKVRRTLSRIHPERFQKKPTRGFLTANLFT